MKTETFLLIGTLLMGLPGRPVATERLRVLWRGTGGWGNKSTYCALFDPKTIQTLRGTVMSVDSVTPLPGMSPGIELELKTDKGVLPIHLGPLWYVENQDIDIQSQDTVEVTGSRIFCEGQDVIAATEVRHGGKKLKLRDNQGRPLWVAATEEQK